jgi:hypothetical protein
MVVVNFSLDVTKCSSFWFSIFFTEPQNLGCRGKGRRSSEDEDENENEEEIETENE